MFLHDKTCTADMSCHELTKMICVCMRVVSRNRAGQDVLKEWEHIVSIFEDMIMMKNMRESPFFNHAASGTYISSIVQKYLVYGRKIPRYLAGPHCGDQRFLKTLPILSKAIHARSTYQDFQRLYYIPLLPSRATVSSVDEYKTRRQATLTSVIHNLYSGYGQDRVLVPSIVLPMKRTGQIYLKQASPEDFKNAAVVLSPLDTMLHLVQHHFLTTPAQIMLFYLLSKFFYEILSNNPKSFTMDRLCTVSMINLVQILGRINKHLPSNGIVLEQTHIEAHFYEHVGPDRKYGTLPSYNQVLVATARMKPPTSSCPLIQRDVTVEFCDYNHLGGENISLAMPVRA